MPLTEPAVLITYPVRNAIRNTLNLITDARKQLPNYYRGIIALKMFNGYIVLNHILNRIKNNEYSRIAAIIVVDNNGLFPIKNRLHNDISDAVLNVPSFLFI